MSPKTDTFHPGSVKATTRHSGNREHHRHLKLHSSLDLAHDPPHHHHLLLGRQEDMPHSCHRQWAEPHTLCLPGTVHALRLHVLGGGGLGGFLPLLSMQGSR